MCLIIGVTHVASTTFLLSLQYTVGEPVLSAKAFMYLRINLVFLTALYMHLIYPSVELDAISG